MPTFHINVVNQHFSSSNEHEVATVAEAKAEAIRGALQIGIAEVSEAQPFFGAEVVVGRDGERLARYVVSIGVSPIQ